MTTLFPMQELTSVQCGNVEAIQSIANVILEANHKIVLLNIELARNTLQHGSASLNVDAIRESGNAIPYQPLTKDGATYLKALAHISAETQVETARLLQSYLSEFGKNTISLLDRASKSETNAGAAIAAAALKSAIATATASCHSLTEATKRVTEMAQANANALAETVQSMHVKQEASEGSLQKAA